MTKRANDYLICSVWVRAVFSVLSDTLRPCGSYFHRILWRELSSVHRILQARILEWVAMPSSRRSSGPRDGTHVSYVSALAARFFTTSATWERKWSLSRVRLFAIPRTVTTIHGIFQARILEQVANTWEGPIFSGSSINIDISC